jgi:hypothetical protein
MLERLRTRAVGAVDVAVQSYAARQVHSLITRMITLSVQSWEAEGFLRFGDGEVDCTVRLYDWCDRLIDADRTAWPAMRVQYDGALPSAGMRAGIEDPMRTVRPDLFLFVGSISIHIEAKRLGVGGSLPKFYVDRGLKRFLSSSYAWQPSARGVMISYNLVDSPSDGLAVVNEKIEQDPTLGSTHLLTQIDLVLPKVSLHKSSHGLHFDIFHYAIDMR